MAKRKFKFPKMNWKILVPVAVVLIFAGVVFAVKQTSEVSDDWKTYINKSEKYTLRHPKELLPTSICGNDGEVILATDKVDCGPGFPSKGKLLMWIITYEGERMEGFLKPTIYEETLEGGWKITDKKEIIVGGVLGTEILWRSNRGDVSSEVIIFDNNKTYRFSQLSGSNYEEDRKIFNQIVSTFEFID